MIKVKPFLKIFLILVVIIVVSVSFIFFGKKNNDQNSIVCTVDVKICPDGSFVYRTGPDCQFAKCPSSPKSNLIKVLSPKPESVISSPLKITGEARGYWFFEGSFPVILTNWDGLIIAQGVATAEGEWMTEEFVPFKATLNFTKPEYTGEFSKRGALILKKDNPSDLPEHDDSLEITVYFN